MDTFVDFSKRLRPGRPLKMVVYGDSGSVSVKGVIACSDPLSVRVSGSHASTAKEGTRAMLLAVDRVQYVKAEAKILSIDQDEQEYTWILGCASWEQVDRRRYERHPVRLPVEMKAVIDEGVSSNIVYCNGTTADISMGGAWINLERMVPAGSLVEFRSTLPNGSDLKILSVITHSESELNGHGVQFLDYVGDSRQTLRGYFDSLAA